MHRTLLLLAALAVAADWPRFRGPNGTGVSDDTLPTTFKEGDGILWKVPLPGSGNGSPVVAGGKLFLQAATEGGGERLLLCLDAKDGRTLWSRSAVGAAAKAHRKNSLASSTPAVGGDRVVALFWDGRREALHAYDLAGNFKWMKDLGPFKSQHGSGASPVIDNGRVFLNRDQDESAALLAFSADDGRELWHADRKGVNACYTTPAVRPLPGGKSEVVVFSTTAVTGYDAESGRPNWNWDWDWPGDPLRTVASAVMWNDVVFAHAGEGAGSSRVVAVRTGSPPRVIWEKGQKGGFPYVPCLLVRGDTLYAVTDRGIAGCFDAATGKEVWTHRLAGGFSASPVLAGGTVYAVNEEGVIFAYTASRREPAAVARSPLGEPVVASPAVAGGRMYVRGQAHLFCLGK
jgi:outer membrane protein assembly factor BamB